VESRFFHAVQRLHSSLVFEKERDNTIACGCCYTIGCWAAPQLLQTLSISTLNPKPQACCTHCPHQPLECLWRVSSSVCWCTTSSMYVVRQIPSLRKLTTPHHGQHQSGLLQILIQDSLSCDKDFWMYNYPFDTWFCDEFSGRDGVRKRTGVKKERAHTKIDLSVPFFRKSSTRSLSSRHFTIVKVLSWCCCWCLQDPTHVVFQQKIQRVNGRIVKKKTQSGLGFRVLGFAKTT
jgi:hypothetical protein